MQKGNGKTTFAGQLQAGPSGAPAGWPRSWTRRTNPVGTPAGAAYEAVSQGRRRYVRSPGQPDGAAHEPGQTRTAQSPLGPCCMIAGRWEGWRAGRNPSAPPLLH